MKVDGAVAIVTGGASGFGKAFSEALLKRGAKVCFADINTTDGLHTEKTFRQNYGEDSSMFVKCDVSNETEIKGLFDAAISKYQYVDIIVNNAGINNEITWKKMFQINLFGVVAGSNIAIEHMRKDKGGKGGLIVNVASAGGLFPIFFNPSYSASKFGVVGFTRSWAQNPLAVSKYGISFAVLCPSFSKTNMFTDMMSSKEPPLVTYDDNKDNIREIINDLGITSVEAVTAAFLEIVEKENNNGAVVTIDTMGIQYRYANHPNKL